MRGSPTALLLVGLAITLLLIAGFSGYTVLQLSSLRRLQSEIIDANRRDSLQLVRIQNNLHGLALSMRDMLEGTEPYPLSGWKPQYDRIRLDLQDALRREQELSTASRTPEQRAFLESSVSEFWSGVDRLFELARQNRESEARALLRTTLRSQLAAITNTVARLLVQNSAAEEEAAAEIQSIYDGVERNIYLLLGAVVLLIAGTSLYLIYVNRALFANLAAVSDQRRFLARKLITVQEEIFRSVARELHDEFGQILTAIGAMLSRASKKGLPPDSPFQVELKAVQEVAQETIEKVRGLSQTLHPNVLDDYGLEGAIEWHLRLFEKQTGIKVVYEKQGGGPPVRDEAAIHVYRILQEALNNAAKHARTPEVSVLLRYHDGRMELRVEDRGVGMTDGRSQPGLGMIGMRERAELLQGRLNVASHPGGGTAVSLEIPMERATVHER